MNNTPKVSVILSVYNGETYLKEAIDSVLNQSFTDFEFIIIDDGSKDNTPKILGTYTDPRIIIVTNTSSLGLTKSLNLGLQKARGQYIARMDADDISLPDRLHKQVEFLDSRSDIVCVGGGTTIINNDGKEIGYKAPITDPELIKFYLILKNQITHPSVCFRKSIIIQNGSYNEEYIYAQDYALWSTLLLNGLHISNINTPILKYRLHESSITQGNNKDTAYKSALKTTKRNLEHYIEVRDYEFDIFMQSFHRHTVTGFNDARLIVKLIQTFEKSYIEKEKPTQKNIAIIKAYLQKEKQNTWRWFIKNSFPRGYFLAAKVKYLLSK